MFTGLVAGVGTITKLLPISEGLQADVAFEWDTSLELGESISHDGVCLTVTNISRESYTVFLGAETLKCTTAHDWVVGGAINLERALLATDRLGGHFVSGHVDGVGRVASVTPGEGNHIFNIEAPSELSSQVAKKGSICVNGVSLTVNEVEGNHFSVALIPHTLSVTTLGKLSVDSQVNLETDVLAKYCERMLALKS